MQVPLKNKPDNYYKIPVNYRLASDHDKENSGDASSLKKLERNYLYDILVEIDKEGSGSSLTPVELNAECIIIPWKEELFETSFPSNHWLFVKEDSIRMINTNEYKL